MSETVDETATTGDATASNTNVVATEEQTEAPPPAAPEQYQFNIDESGAAAAEAVATAEAEAAAQAAAAAAAPAAAAEPAPAPVDQLHAVCRICGKDSDDGGGRKRLLIRFLPVESLPDDTTTTNTWDQDICLHMFCGKTASILPAVNRPELEILSKAGVKNKHGIGPEVNAALARTRCAELVNLHEVASREKEFYLIKEFEAHLMSIRAIHSAATEAAAYQYHYAAAAAAADKPILHKAGQTYKRRDEWALAAAADDSFAAHQAMQHEETEANKIRCGCGGTHLSPDTPNGADSWRTHVMTKRHQKWMEENGMLGAV